MEFFISNSSWIDRVEYDKDTFEMIMYTKSGKDYKFINVPNDIFEEFKSAPSHGQYYNAYIKGRYEDPKYN